MVNYLSKQEAKEIDNKLYNLGFSTEQLVEMAGQAAFEVIQNIIQTKQQTILVVIGPGNNGADGLVIARWLSYVGHKVSILMHKTNSVKLLDICMNLNIKIETEIPNIVYDYIIDALFGISGYLPVKEPYMSFIEFFKDHPRIISIDVPSSYDVDKLNENPLFVPIGVVCLFGPKKCCQNLKTYVTRSFAPKSVFCDESYTNYVTYTEL